VTGALMAAGALTAAVAVLIAMSLLTGRLDQPGSPCPAVRRRGGVPQFMKLWNVP